MNRKITRFAFAANDDVDGTALGQDFLRMVGRVDSAIDRRGRGPAAPGGLQRIEASGMGRSRSRMAGHHDSRAPGRDVPLDLRGRHMVPLGIEQSHLVPGIDEWATDAQETERYLMADAVRCE